MLAGASTDMAQKLQLLPALPAVRLPSASRHLPRPRRSPASSRSRIGRIPQTQKPRRLSGTAEREFGKALSALRVRFPASQTEKRQPGGCRFLSHHLLPCFGSVRIVLHTQGAKSRACIGSQGTFSGRLHVGSVYGAQNEAKQAEWSCINRAVRRFGIVAKTGKSINIKLGKHRKVGEHKVRALRYLAFLCRGEPCVRPSSCVRPSCVRP